MENTKKNSLLQITMTWGLITGLAGVIYGLLLYFMDLSLNKPAGYVAYVILIAGIFLGCKAYRDQALGGYISYGQALGAGVLISLFYAIISSIFFVVLYQFIAPELIEKAMEESMQKMSEKGYSEEQMEQGIALAKKFFSLFAVMGAIFAYVFFGFLFSLIIAIFVKKEGSPFDRDMSSVDAE